MIDKPLLRTSKQLLNWPYCLWPDNEINNLEEGMTKDILSNNGLFLFILMKIYQLVLHSAV